MSPIRARYSLERQRLFFLGVASEPRRCPLISPVTMAATDGWRPPPFHGHSTHNGEKTLSMNFDPSEPGYPRQSFPWGCLLGGCLGAFLVMIAGIGLIGWSGYSFYQAQIQQYTSETPKELPVVELDEDRIAELEQRVETFHEQVEEGKPAEPLILTAEDINALVSRNEDMRGRVYVTIEDGQISAEVSVPTDVIPGAGGRFFNGSLTVDASLTEGELVVKPQEASVNGEPVPEQFMQGFREENLAQDVDDDPEAARWLRKFESMRVEDDRIILTPKPPEIESDDGADPTPAPAQDQDSSENQLETDDPPPEGADTDSPEGESASQP